MIPSPGEIYQHKDGDLLLIREVELSAAMQVVRVEFVVGTAVCEANAEGWETLRRDLTRVEKPAAPSPIAQIKLDFLNHAMQDLRLMQALEKEFAMATGDIPFGYTERENVTILAGRGPLAAFLKDLGIRIHQHLLKLKTDGTQDPNLN